MRCSRCKSEWNTSASIATSIQTCPFCGESLAEEKNDEKFDTEEAVIASTYQQFGEEALRNGKRMMAISVFAPELKRDKRMLS